ncbi:ABC transporter, ATP-binding protein [[Eubacterium] yurii subsp. margaretiae ATCC 43715]|nr:ABC transporter, ATP-binding protein [[Eubacterium] yurii subsp. margaretiae ATCC 43715]
MKQNDLNVIETKNLSFAYEGEKAALKDVSFKLQKGSLVFVAGNSGAGKSTLLNIINGLIPEVIEGKLQGTLVIENKGNLKIEERSKIIGNVFQNPRSQFFTTNSTAELVFAMENFGISKEEMEKRLSEIVDKFDLENLMNRNIFKLSSGERQLLALASALIMDPSVIIFDEPSANLDYGNAMRLKNQLKKLKDEGKTIIVADHRCFYLKGLIDTVLLLEDNTVKFYATEDEYFKTVYGKRAIDLFEGAYKSREIIPSTVEDVIIEGVTYKDILNNINITFNKNEVATIVGVNGAGKTTLVRLLSKVIKADKGAIKSEGQALYIMQDADYQLFGASCLKELEISQSDEKINLEALDSLGLYDLKDAHPHSLSGGEKQRLQMAISKVSSNQVIIFDEPTSGLDKNSMQKVVALIEEMKQNHTIIVISHDYEFIRNVSDRIVYLADKSMKESFYLNENEFSRLNEIFKEMEEYYYYDQQVKG